jgi:hypothetical protein
MRFDPVVQLAGSWSKASVRLDAAAISGFALRAMCQDKLRVHPAGTIGNITVSARVVAPILSAMLALGCLLVARVAVADAYGITHPRQHIDYSFELEPEVIVTFGRPLNDGPGIGVRGSIPVLFNGFIPGINNSVAVSFGFDKDPVAKRHDFYVPLVLQWNFWLHRNFSVFGEPGILLQFADKTRPYFQVWGGARVHFTDAVALTARMSVPESPAASLGLSFFF